MDTERFIEEVRRRRSLWDQKDANYHSRAACHRLWAEIGCIFNLPVSRAKTKWKSLRDLYRVELKKFIKTQAGELTLSPGSQPSNWKHFDSMTFIREQLHIRTGHAGEEDAWFQNGCDYESSKAGADEMLAGELAHQDFCQLEYPVKQESGDELDSQRTLEERRLLIEVEKLQLMREERAARTDDDYLFLMSLLPSIRSLSPARRMALRSKMHDLVFQQVYGDAAK